MRTVSLKANQGGSIGDFKDNYVSTTKYTPLTFLPMALFEQYRRVANQYFTVQAILSLTPISPVQPFSTWTPLLFVLGVSMLKEFLEDRARLRQDREQNARPCRVARGGEWSEAQWRDVRVGDVLIVEKDEAFPCDIVMLASSGDEGGCYVETMNLDGETNLKPKKAQELPEGFLERSANASPAAFEGVRIECETPNASLYTFRGNIHFDNHGARDENGEPVAPSAVLLRGSSLRNTDWVVGGAIFTGHDTKVMQNSVEAPAKRSTIERNLDYVVGVMFALLVTLATITGIVTGVWTKERLPDMWYLMPEDAPTQFDPTNAPAVGFFGSITSLVLYGYLIPISLYVSIEMVKVGQAFWFINRDAQMYDKETDTWARARTSNLNEELGQVANILSDKTGTLTQNRMTVDRVWAAGRGFGPFPPACVDDVACLVRTWDKYHVHDVSGVIAEVQAQLRAALAAASDPPDPNCPVGARVKYVSEDGYEPELGYIAEYRDDKYYIVFDVGGLDEDWYDCTDDCLTVLGL